METQKHGAGHGHQPQADGKCRCQRLRSRAAQARKENRNHCRRKKTGCIHEPEYGRVSTHGAGVPEPLQKEKIDTKIDPGGQYAQADGKNFGTERPRK